MRYTHTMYEFIYRVGDQAEWIALGSIDSKDISNFDFTGPIIGVFAISPDPDMMINFSNFSVDSNVV